MRSRKEKNKCNVDAFIRHAAKKLKAVDILGGKCTKCGETNPWLLDFHHAGKDKINWVTYLLDGRWSAAANEIKKCKLLCRNCHVSIHREEQPFVTKYKKYETNKKLFLEYVGAKECSRCGYTGHNSTLVFHHIDPTQKIFAMSAYGKALYTLEDLQENITDELDKCVVLCQNCHTIEHIDERYEKFRNEIYEASQNIKEQQQIDHQEVIRLHNVGLSYRKIMKQLNIKNISNISYIVNGGRKDRACRSIG